ncbi:MAG TPA: hypothetical protein VJ809_03510 [Pirellulales bacterium]|nr:hypothetical protein [Pirellulales bacterium]
MSFIETRPNWLSEIIEQHRRAGDRPIPLIERKAERDAIVAAIQAHPEGQMLAAMPDLADVVWGALGAAYHFERDARVNPQPVTSSPAIHASLAIFSAARLSTE